MKPIYVILAVFIFNCSFGQVDNYDLLSKNISSSGVKSITKYANQSKSEQGDKKFMIEFDRSGKLTLVQEYSTSAYRESIYLGIKDSSYYLSKRQEMHYDDTGKNVAIHIFYPGGRLVIDTLLYNERNELIEMRMIEKGVVVRVWDYSVKAEDDIDERVHDSRGNLIKEIYNYENYTTFAYDANNNLIEWIIIRAGKIYEKETYEYDSNNRLIAMQQYYKPKDENARPAKYYFEYAYH